MKYFADSGKESTGTKEKRDENRYQFDDMFTGTFYADMPDETWISGKEQRVKHSKIMMMKIDT